MTNKPKTFYCTSTDWHMARAYSDIPISNMDSIEGNHRWYMAPLVVFVGSAIGSMLHMHWIWVVGILCAFPLFLICYQRRYTAFHHSLIENFQFAAPEKQIPFVSLDDQQLIGHFYRPDGSQSHHIKLSEISSITFTTHSYNLNKFMLPVLLNKKAKQLGAEVIPELWTDRSRYVLTIYIKTKVLSRCMLPIPEQWFNDETLAVFIQSLEKKANKQLEMNHSNSVDATLIRYLEQYTSRLR